MKTPLNALQIYGAEITLMLQIVYILKTQTILTFVSIGVIPAR